MHEGMRVCILYLLTFFSEWSKVVSRRYDRKFLRRHPRVETLLRDVAHRGNRTRAPQARRGRERELVQVHLPRGFLPVGASHD